MKKVQSREDFLKILATILPQESNGVEIGVLYGDFSEMILKIVSPICLFLVDPYKIGNKRYNRDPNSLTTAYSTEEDYLHLLGRFEDEIKTGKVIVLKTLSYDAVKNINDNLFDFVYIDASHLYEDIKRDLNDWLPKLKENGLMCGHDYITDYKKHIIRAVDEFAEEQGFEMIIFNENGGDWALKRKQ